MLLESVLLGVVLPEAMVRPAGLEPARPKAGDFKSPVSTDSTMAAQTGGESLKF